MLDCVVRNEKEPDVVQISGGEPTLHPDFFPRAGDVQGAAHPPPDGEHQRHPHCAGRGVCQAAWPTFMPQFELYLQFDSLQREPLMQLRGADLRGHSRESAGAAEPLGISTTLVVTVERGVNDGELGAIVDYALDPAGSARSYFSTCAAGRAGAGFQSAQHRLTLTEVRRRILEQTSVFLPEDLIPVPCHPDALAMAYALKLDGKTVPLTGMVPPEVLIDGAKNTIVYEQEAGLREHLFKLFATNHSPTSQASTLKELLCCLPKVLIPKGLGYENLFRILIVQFIDADAFDVRSVKKSCIHIAHPDGKRLIPFDTFNMFYRGELETTRLTALREAEMAFAGER